MIVKKVLRKFKVIYLLNGSIQKSVLASKSDLAKGQRDSGETVVFAFKTFT